MRLRVRAYQTISSQIQQHFGSIQTAGQKSDQDWVTFTTAQGSGTLESHDQAKACILNEYFAVNFTKEKVFTEPEFEDSFIGRLLTDVLVSTQAKLLALKPSCAPGPDDINPRVLRELSHTLARPFSVLFRRLLLSSSPRPRHRGIVDRLWYERKPAAKVATTSSCLMSVGRP